MPEYYFDHVHLTSPDPHKTAEFYEKYFGAKLVSTNNMGSGRITIKLSLNGTIILVSTPRGDPSQIGLDHFGIQTDDLGDAINELKSRGVTFTQEKTEVKPNLTISFLSAPDNVKIELQEGEL